MSPTELALVLKDAFEEGVNNTEVDDLLFAHAQQFIDDIQNKQPSEDEKAKIIKAYIKGYHSGY